MSKPLLKPVSDLKKRKRNESSDNICILCNLQCNEERSSYPLNSWNDLKRLAHEWKKLDTFGEVFDSVSWDDGPSGKYFHKVCRMEIAGERKLQQAKSRYEKNTNKQQIQTSCANESVENDPATSGRRTRSKGMLHNKDLCIWCMKPEDKAHPDRDKFFLLQQQRAWQKFKAHTVYLEDMEMRDRILRIIDCTHDPFATEIRYHRSCWCKYVTDLYRDDQDQPIHGLTRSREIVDMMKNLSALATMMFSICMLPGQNLMQNSMKVFQKSWPLIFLVLQF